MAIVRHVTWTGASQVIRLAVQFTVSVILARLLGPEVFGLLALANVFVGFARIFSDFGLGSALVQQSGASAEDRSFIFWINLIVGVVLTAAMAASAPLIAAFYHDPRLIPITLLVSPEFFVSSVGILPKSLLQKEFAFQRLAVIEIGGAVSSAVVGIVLALRGWGVYSLVFASLADAVVSTALAWKAVPWLPSLAWRSTRTRGLLSYGLGLLGFNTLNYWMRNGDNLLIGKFCGAWELGIYNRAYSLLLFPVSQVHQVLTKVMFPALAAVQHSKTDFRKLYLRGCRDISFVMFPVMVGLIVTADDFITAVYGRRWVAVIPVIRILAIAGVGQCIGTTVGWIYTASGRTDLMFKWSVWSAPVLIAAFIIGVRSGAVGVAAAYTVACVLLWYPMWRVAGSIIDLDFKTTMLAVARPFACAVLMSAVALTVKMAASTFSTEPALRLIAVVSAGAISYPLFVRLVDPTAFAEITGAALALLGLSARAVPHAIPIQHGVPSPE